jgi:hypothetical protein
LNITDPRKTTLFGTFYVPEELSYDVAITKDNKNLFIIGTAGLRYLSLGIQVDVHT